MASLLLADPSRAGVARVGHLVRHGLFSGIEASPGRGVVWARRRLAHDSPNNSAWRAGTTQTQLDVNTGSTGLFVLKVTMKVKIGSTTRNLAVRQLHRRFELHSIGVEV